MEELVLRLGGAATKNLLWENLNETDQASLEARLSDDELKRCTAIDLWVRLRGVSPDRAILEVGLKCEFISREKYISLLDVLGVDDEGLDIDLDAAIKTTPLVLCDPPPGAFWNQQGLMVDWEDQNVVWRYFWELALAAGRGAKIDERNFGEETEKKRLTQWKYRLTHDEHFPIDLAALIGVRGGKHDLELSPENICCFRRTDNGGYKKVSH